MTVFRGSSSSADSIPLLVVLKLAEWLLIMKQFPDVKPGDIIRNWVLAEVVIHTRR